MSLVMLKNIDMPSKFDLPAALSQNEREAEASLFEKAKEAIKKHDVLLIAHYYTAPVIQRLAEETGGFIGDSLEMARVGKESEKQTVLVAGVRFMGETAKILSPEKTVLLPDMTAECSLDLCCKVEELKRMKQEHPNATVVAYANTSAEVKANSDWIVTSSLAVELGEYLKGRGEEILWVPDRHLGSYIANNSKSDVLCWPGRCIVHDSFDADGIQKQKEQYPDAKVLVHPESPAEVVALADCVGSTTQLLNFAKKDDAKRYIVATESGIFYKINQACPDKELIAAAVAPRDGASLEHPLCPWMGLNTLTKIIACLESTGAERKAHEVEVDETIRVEALKPLQRMLDFAADLKAGKLK